MSQKPDDQSILVRPAMVPLIELLNRNWHLPRKYAACPMDYYQEVARKLDLVSDPILDLLTEALTDEADSRKYRPSPGDLVALAAAAMKIRPALWRLCIDVSAYNEPEPDPR